MRKKEWYYGRYSPEIASRLRLADEFVVENCPYLLRLSDVTRSQKTEQLEQARSIIKYILENPIDVDYTKGLPGVGKTTIVNEQERLLKFLGYDVRKVLYDDMLQAVIPFLGDNTDEYDRGQWLFVSYLLVIELFNPHAIDITNKDNLNAHWKLVSSTFKTPGGEDNILSFLKKIAIEYQARPKQITLLEAPGVANVKGKDRAVTTELILNFREKQLQRQGEFPRTLLKQLVPDLRTMKLAAQVRNIAADMNQILNSLKDETNVLHRLDQPLTELKKLGVYPIHSTNYLPELKRWIQKQLAAAPESFINSMYQEDVARAQSWLAENKTERQIIVNEVQLPAEMTTAISSTFSAQQVEELRLLTACYQDSLLRRGNRPDQVFLVINQFLPQHLSTV